MPRVAKGYIEQLPSGSFRVSAGRFDLRNTAARLGHGGGGATTLRHCADPVPEVDRRAAAYLAQAEGQIESVTTPALT